jgi:hypothetical protein
MRYITTYPPSGAHAFNAAYVTRTYSRLAEVAIRHSQVCTLLGYAVMTRHTTDVSPYHMIGTASSKPRLETTGPEFSSPDTRILTILPWRRYVVIESTWQKVNTESKSLLSYHLLILLYSLCRHLSISSL